tara:strand:+ start:795 stop:980 length:186 start_codon:yes stop_codon:yes gene_type:complete
MVIDRGFGSGIQNPAYRPSDIFHDPSFHFRFLPIGKCRGSVWGKLSVVFTSIAGGWKPFDL